MLWLNTLLYWIVIRERYFSVNRLDSQTDQFLMNKSNQNSISEALLRISLTIQRMSASTDVVDVLAVCFLELQKICERIHVMAIHQVVDQAEDLIETYHVGASGTITSPQVRKARHMSRLWRTREINYMPDVQADCPEDELVYLQSKFDGARIGSMLDVPFSSGVISAHSRDPNAFNNDDVEMLKQVAEVFSVGLTRVKDLETIDKRVEELDRFEERYSLAVTAGKTGVWDHDLSTDMIFVDGILWAMIGQDRPSCTVSMDEWTSNAYADDYPKLVDAAQDHFAGCAEDYEVEFRMLHSDGTLRCFLGVARRCEMTMARPFDLSERIPTFLTSNRWRRRSSGHGGILRIV